MLIHLSLLVASLSYLSEAEEYFIDLPNRTSVQVLGVAGPRGEPGPPGRKGIRGPTGDYGPMGDYGLNGPRGPPGMKGMKGPPGTGRGPPGDKGELGNVGQPGVAGPVGPDGFPGDDGKPGAIGPVGDPGPPPRDFVKGAAGGPGPAGVDGTIGPDGTDGLKGAKGDRGLVGPPGRNVKCSFGYLLAPSGACEDLDECSMDNGMCQHTCSNQPGTYRCSCNEGYELGADGESCIDINECASSPCTNGLRCFNGEGIQGLCFNNTAQKFFKPGDKSKPDVASEALIVSETADEGVDTSVLVGLFIWCAVLTVALIVCAVVFVVRLNSEDEPPFATVR